MPGLTVLTPVDVSDLDTVLPTPEIACATDVDDLPVLEPVDVDDLPVLQPVDVDLPVLSPVVIGAQ